MSIINGLRELWRTDNATKQNPVEQLPRRVLQIFHDHGIAVTQIPRLFPQITFEDLQSHSALLPKLTPKFLDEIAQFFNVRIEWLEGLDDSIYEHWSCYTNPRKLIELLNSINYDDYSDPVRFFTTVDRLDLRNPRQQPIVMMVIETVQELGEQQINRYYSDTIWNWAHAKCRIQLKAIARIMFQETKALLPIYKISHEELEKLDRREIVPHLLLHSCKRLDESLEEFAISTEESSIAKETEELPYVLEYIEEHELAFQLRSPDLLLTQSDVYNTIQSAKNLERALKAGFAKNKPGNELKRQFIEKYADKVETKEITAAQAAREFHQGLNDLQVIALCRSAKDYNSSTMDEITMRAIRTLTTAMRKHLKGV